MEARAGVEPTYTDLQPHGALGARIASQEAWLRMVRLDCLKCTAADDKFPTTLLRRPQRFVGLLAGGAGDGESLSESSNSIRSLVKPSTHVG